jgi:hypothetical protein
MGLFNWVPVPSIGNVLGVGAAWYLVYGGLNLMSIAVIILAWYLGDYLFPNPSVPLTPYKPSGGGGGTMPFAY